LSTILFRNKRSSTSNEHKRSPTRGRRAREGSLPELEKKALHFTNGRKKRKRHASIGWLANNFKSKERKEFERRKVFLFF
jgi:hypothetical protein